MRLVIVVDSRHLTLLIINTNLFSFKLSEYFPQFSYIRGKCYICVENYCLKQNVQFNKSFKSKDS